MLGIAPIDRLSELTWLAPLSVALFGLVIGLFEKGYRVPRFDRWTLLLILGAFSGAYPLMYYAQQFVPLPLAMTLSAALVLSIIGIRAVSLAGVVRGLIGVFLPAGIILSITLLAALRPSLQGLLLTLSTLALFVLAMALFPRIDLTKKPDHPLVSPATLT